MYVRSLVGSNKEIGDVLDHFGSSNPLRVFFRENRDSVILPIAIGGASTIQTSPGSFKNQ